MSNAADRKTAVTTAKGSAGVRSCLRHTVRALDLVGMTIDDDHFAVQVGERAQASGIWAYRLV